MTHAPADREPDVRSRLHLDATHASAPGVVHMGIVFVALVEAGGRLLGGREGRARFSFAHVGEASLAPVDIEARHEAAPDGFIVEARALQHGAEIARASWRASRA